MLCLNVLFVFVTWYNTFLCTEMFSHLLDFPQTELFLKRAHQYLCKGKIIFYHPRVAAHIGCASFISNLFSAGFRYNIPLYAVVSCFLVSSFCSARPVLSVLSVRFITLLFCTAEIYCLSFVSSLLLRHTCFISFSSLLFNSFVFVFLSFVFFIRLVANLSPK